MSHGESKTGRPFYSKWYWKDWDAKTKDLDAYEYTAYHRSLSYCATCSPDLCSMPADDRRLARAVGFGLKRWLSVRQKVLNFYILESDGRYRHPRLKEDAQAWLQHCADQQSRRTAGTTDGAPSESPDKHHTRSREKPEASTAAHHLSPTTIPCGIPRRPSSPRLRPSESHRHDRRPRLRTPSPRMPHALPGHTRRDPRAPGLP